jgi:DNA-binding transcriptional LysR family regulator
VASIDELDVFVRVVQHGSLSAAAAHLGLTRSAVSRRIQATEQRLGVRLLDRTTRRLELTDAGRAFFRRGQRIMAELSEAEREAGEFGSQPRGTLRVSCLVMIALRSLLPLLPDFARLHPGIHVQLDLSDAATGSNLAQHDVAICWGEQVDSRLMSTRLFRSRQVYCAAPSYLDRHGAPQHPRELADHTCLLLSRLGLTTNRWEFVTPDGPLMMAVSGNLVVNNGDAQYEALLLGMGIARVTDLRVREDVQAGRLRFVLEHFTPREDTAIYIVYRKGQPVPRKVRAFVTYLKQRMDGRRTG